MKKLFYMPLLAVLLGFASCQFFETDPDNVLNEDQYIAKESEMYRGFLGIITRMQEAGDHAIFLTDPRSNYMETTGNAPIALQNLYRYESTDGNEYADPRPYYALIVSCNDFMTKLDDFYQRVDGALSDSAKVHIPRLVSSALRHKVWGYYMLGRIYGEAYWYDTNMTELDNLDNDKVFTKLDMKGICDYCIDLLDNGVELCGQRIPANLEMDWTYWVNPMGGNAAYKHWNLMTPRWINLRAELASWRTNYEDEAAARADWQWVRDNVLRYLTESMVNGGHWYSCTMQIILEYPNIFWTEQVAYEPQIMGAVFYDYQNKQTNRLVQYFCPEYPADGYYLKPAEKALEIYTEADIRGPKQRLVCNTLGGQLAFSKYYYTRLNNQGYLRQNIFEIQPTIPLFRGHDLHFLLAEAENHLGHWDVAKTLLNTGLLNRFPGGRLTLPADSLDGQAIWSEYYWADESVNWFAPAGGYGDIGIVGANRGKEYDLPVISDDATDAEKLAFAYDKDRIKAYDLALADEYLKEFTGEGKSYSYLVKMAERYGKDYKIVFDRVKAKYADASQVEASLQEKYFIDWTLE
ncbi:MAG: hypothetical protein J6Q26_01705 [Bacteroidales bacterium]|nr:hypothetical protein [Bacteroidales bacterium]